MHKLLIPVAKDLIFAFSVFPLDFFFSFSFSSSIFFNSSSNFINSFL